MCNARRGYSYIHNIQHTRNKSTIKVYAMYSFYTVTKELINTEIAGELEIYSSEWGNKYCSVSIYSGYTVTHGTTRTVFGFKVLNYTQHFTFYYRYSETS